jgi:hypothetical protein
VHERIAQVAHAMQMQSAAAEQSEAQAVASKQFQNSISVLSQEVAEAASAATRWRRERVSKVRCSYCMAIVAYCAGDCCELAIALGTNN